MSVSLKELKIKEQHPNAFGFSVIWDYLTPDEREIIFNKRYPCDDWFYKISAKEAFHLSKNELPARLVEVFWIYCDIY